MEDTDCFSIVFGVRACIKPVNTCDWRQTNNTRTSVHVAWRHFPWVCGSRFGDPAWPMWWSGPVVVYYHHCRRAVPATDMTYSRDLAYFLCVTMIVSHPSRCVVWCLVLRRHPFQNLQREALWVMTEITPAVTVKMSGSTDTFYDNETLNLFMAHLVWKPLFKAQIKLLKREQYHHFSTANTVIYLNYYKLRCCWFVCLSMDQ